MQLNNPKPLAFAVLTALALASASNLLAITTANADTPAANADTPAASTSTPTKVDGTPPATAASKTDATAKQPDFALDEGTAVTNEPALQALHHINAASAALANKDIKTAETSLDEADKLLKSLKDSLPTAKIREKLESASQTPDTADWTSIYQQLDQVKVFQPAATAKQAGKTPPPSAESVQAVLVALQYTEIDLPVKSAIGAVEKAQAALKKEDITAASNALKDAENSVVVLQGIAEDPLVQAHLSIWQALANMKNGSISEARHYMDEAIGLLEKASQSTDKAAKEAADKLLEEGKALQAALAKETQSGSETSKLTGQVESFGLHTEAWAERALNYAYAKTAEVTGNALKDALIEARFHISNAAIDLDTAQDPSAASQELQQAQGFLKQALQQADNLWSDATHKQQVTDMQAQLDKLMQEKPAQLASGNQLHQFRQALQSIILTL